MSGFGPVQRIQLQTVTYWAPGSMGSDSEVSHDAPILINGRWEESSTVIRNARGEELTSKTMVVVDRDVEEGGYLKLGIHTSEPSPFLADAEEIQGFTSMPDLRNLEQIRRAYL